VWPTILIFDNLIRKFLSLWGHGVAVRGHASAHALQGGERPNLKISTRGATCGSDCQKSKSLAYLSSFNKLEIPHSSNKRRCFSGLVANRSDAVSRKYDSRSWQ
jgi:hypothetical protein